MFDELVASQPTGDNIPDDVMDKEGASAPENNADGLPQGASTPLDNVDGGQEDAKYLAMQKRIDKGIKTAFKKFSIAKL